VPADLRCASFDDHFGGSPQVAREHSHAVSEDRDEMSEDRDEMSEDMDAMREHLD
jgi:hypothetical protein